MLPRFDVDVRVGDINAGLLRVVWTDEVTYDGIGDNRAYADVTGADWSNVGQVIEAEAALLQTAAATALDATDFDRTVDRFMDDHYPGEDIDEGPLSEFAMLDVGVMAAVAALSAAGAVSTTSCRGHSDHGEPNPLVRFTADEHRLPLIRDACARSGSGLLLDHLGMLQLYAADALTLVEFARGMVELRDRFDTINSDVACDRPSDDLLDNYGADLRRRDLYVIWEQTPADQRVECTGQLSFDDM
jgi:hypothetical protein